MTEDEFVKTAIAWFEPWLERVGLSKGQVKFYLFGPPYVLYADTVWAPWVFTEQSGKWLPYLGRIEL